MAYTPGKSPLVPQSAWSSHCPENTRRVDLGFPPPSHPHINQRVPRCNEELPKSQSDWTDFREVLRKKHANGAVRLCDRRMERISESGYFIIYDQLVIQTTANVDISLSKRRHIIHRRTKHAVASRLRHAAFAPYELTKAHFLLIPKAEIVGGIGADRCNRQ